MKTGAVCLILVALSAFCWLTAQQLEVGGRSSMIVATNDPSQYKHLTWMPESNAPTYFPQFSTNMATTNWQTFTNLAAQTGQMSAYFFMSYGQTAYLRVVRMP